MPAIVLPAPELISCLRQCGPLSYAYQTDLETVVLLRLGRDIQQQATFNDILDADVC